MGLIPLFSAKLFSEANSIGLLLENTVFVKSQVGDIENKL